LRTHPISIASTPEVVRASAPAAAIILASVALFSLAGLLRGGFFQMPLWALGVFVVLTLCAPMTASTTALHVTVFCGLVLLAYRSPPMAIHPFPLVVALGSYGVAVLATARLRESIAWLRFGSLDAGVLRLVFVVVILAAVALPAWYLLAKPDVAPIPELPLWAFPPAPWLRHRTARGRPAT
jgi:hypothetical protein